MRSALNRTLPSGRIDKRPNDKYNPAGNRPAGHRMEAGRVVLRSMLVLAVLVFSGNAQAELGDYSSWKSFKNLFNPVRPDRPVQSSEATGSYPLTLDDQGFNDGFNPRRYYKWQTIQMDPATGASCGNGSPYKIFVNRSPRTSNMMVYMEGGGACWDERSCRGTLGMLGARNPNGVPDDYLKSLDPATALVSPFVFRLHPYESIETQDWTMVYIPYCTGDVYVGDSVQVYDDDPTDPPLIWHHNGFRNVLAATSWIRNNLERPGQMLSTGCSAGGTGSLATYEPVRGAISPQKGYLINDSGPLFAAPVAGSSDNYPSIPLALTIRNAWGLDAGGSDSPLGFLASRLPAFDSSDTGTIYRGLSDKFNDDRMGHVHFWQDYNYSRYSYERFYPEIYNDPDPVSRKSKITALWSQDTETLRSEISNYSNFGYYFPNFRDLNDSHCSTIVDFRRGDIQEQGLQLEDFLDNVLNGNGPVLEASEDDRVSDQLRRRDWFYALLESLL